MTTHQPLPDVGAVCDNPVADARVIADLMWHDKPVEVTVGVEAAREIVRLLPALIVEAVKQRATKGGDR